MFDPATITIKAGESVTWTNNVGFPHNVVFDEDAVPVRASHLSRSSGGTLVSPVQFTVFTNYILHVHLDCDFSKLSRTPPTCAVFAVKEAYQCWTFGGRLLAVQLYSLLYASTSFLAWLHLAAKCVL